MKEHILVVDDDLFLCHLLEKILTMNEFHVSVAHDGFEAVDQIKRNPPDLILMDFLMPNQNGYETLQWLKGDLLIEQVPVIMMGDNASEFVIQSFLDAGADGYIRKSNITSSKILLNKICAALSS